MGSPRLLIVFTLATALVVAGVIALATGSWWVLVVVLVVHLAVTSVVVSGIFSRTEQQDKPDPTTEARVEQEGEDKRGQTGEDRELII
jgi:membrane protein implicated in regulation of membrane protease activity